MLSQKQLSTDIYVPLYIIILIVAIPQLSETIYVPALPELARDLKITANVAEYTLTIYLLGFAAGVLIWGSLSDYYGRKPCLLIGLFIYMLASLGCFFASNIDFLLAARFVQAFGASVGSVLGQAIARDAIKPENRGKMFSTVSIAMAFAPAIGPIIGGFIAQFSHWSVNFLALIALGASTCFLIITTLPETNLNRGAKRSLLSLYLQCFRQILKDKRLLGFAFLIGAVNGILFGYFAEAPFFFTEGLGLPVSSFGLISFFICIPLALGGAISRKLHSYKISADNIIILGITIMCIGSVAFFLSEYTQVISQKSLIPSVIQTIWWVGVVITGLAMIIPNCLSQALENYGNFAGTAASLFGFLYYLIVAGFTALMGSMHNGTLTPLPLFILNVSTAMLVVFYIAVKKKKEA